LLAQIALTLSAGLARGVLVEQFERFQSAADDAVFVSFGFLMIPSAGPQYVTVVLPLMAVLCSEAWRRKGAEVVTGAMIAWSIAAWLSMIALEVPWRWLKVVGPMTWVLLLLAPASLSPLASISSRPEDWRPQR
jgi:hypothetical protein